MIKVKADNLDLRFSNRVLLSGASFKILEGDFILIKGEIGSGKSSLLKLLSRDLKPSGGGLQFHCEPKEIAYVPQFRSASFHIPLNLKEVVEFLNDSELTPFSVLPAELSERSWNEASGGERTLCLLEAAFQSRPKLLLLDEILTWLDLKNEKLVLERLSSLRQSQDSVAVVMVEHKEVPLSFSKTWTLMNGKLSDRL